MYIEKQPTTLIEKSRLVESVTELKNKGYRLVVITCTLSENYDITYSFDKEGEYVALRVSFPKSDAVIPSITGVFLAAFTYENELQDLFGLSVPGMALNFNGSFYKTAIKNPFTVPKPSKQAA